MRFLYLTLIASVFIFNTSCKKDKTQPAAGNASVETQTLAFVSSTAVYGGDYTFKLTVKEQGEVTEYGIVYKAWIQDASDKTPKVGAAGCRTIVFGTKLPAAGTVDSKNIALTFAEFNDANYRAYAILKSGEVVYGEIKYFVSS